MNTFVPILYTGVVLGSIFAACSVGLALLYGTLRFLNLAHGGFLVIGGYVAWYDIEFEHGVESAVPTEDLKIYTTEAHEKKDKDKKKMLPAKKGKHSDEMDEESFAKKS